MNNFNFTNIDVTNIDSIGLILGFFSIFIGMKSPDWDMKLKLKHRSILTHSPLLSIIYIYIFFQHQSSFLWFHRENEIGFRYFIIGFSLGQGIHFIYDLFPKSFRGSALLHVPIINIKLAKKQSLIVLTLSTVISLVISITLIRSIEERMLFLFLSLLIIWLNRKKEDKFIRPTLCFIFLFFWISLYR